MLQHTKAGTRFIAECSGREVYMRRRFNTTGLCYPDEHYMVNMEERLEEIQALVDQREYFVINRARQYGKTTTMNLLMEKIAGKYAVFSISFEGMEDEAFASAYSFCQNFYSLLNDELLYHTVEGISDTVRKECGERSITGLSRRPGMGGLSEFISQLCREADRPVVLMIDEVDQACSYDIFITFLGMLRKKYLARRKQPTFHSVILAGVYDIKNMKSKIRKNMDHQYNSPWNIAADFMVDMSFSSTDIAGMLEEYEGDVRTEMDIFNISEMLYEYTSGYPFLVSRLCKILDEQVYGREGFEDLPLVWTKDGVLEAVKILLAEPNTLFDDMVKKLNDFPELRQAMRRILLHGEQVPYNVDNYVINLGIMFGFMKLEDGSVQISNRIFETRVYNLFISEEVLRSEIYRAASADKDCNRFIHNGKLDMEQVLERFVASFTDIYADADETFVEENGRRFFLLYLKPIINGVGNFYIEARTRNMRRTDVVIDYRGEQIVCELKIWHGKEYNRRGEEQLLDYLDAYHLTTGYMLSFNFNKDKKTGTQKIRLGDKILIEAVV